MEREEVVILFLLCCSGMIRWWPYDHIDIAEADYDSGSLNVAIPNTKELEVPHAPYPANIQHIAVNGDRWLIQDCKNGVIWNYNTASKEF